MIEYDLISYLASDAMLDMLLGIVGDDKKIYPSLPTTEPVLPYILYYYGTGDETDELIDEDRIQLTVRAATKQTATDIRNRLKFLLDRQDEIKNTTFTSAAYYIYYCKFSAGDGFYEPETKVWNEVLFFLVKYRKK